MPNWWHHFQLLHHHSLNQKRPSSTLRLLHAANSLQTFTTSAVWALPTSPLILLTACRSIRSRTTHTHLWNSFSTHIDHNAEPEQQEGPYLTYLFTCASLIYYRHDILHWAGCQAQVALQCIDPCMNDTLKALKHKKSMKNTNGCEFSKDYKVVLSHKSLIVCRKTLKLHSSVKFCTYFTVHAAIQELILQRIAVCTHRYMR